MKMTTLEKLIIVFNFLIGLTIVVGVILDMTSLKETLNIYFVIALGVETFIGIVCLILNTTLKNVKKSKFLKGHKSLA